MGNDESFSRFKKGDILVISVRAFDSFLNNYGKRLVEKNKRCCICVQDIVSEIRIQFKTELTAPILAGNHFIPNKYILGKINVKF